MLDEYFEWMKERCGKFTASEIHRLMTSGRGGKYFSADGEKYIRSKAAEILTQEINNGGRRNTDAMEWGNSHEQEAFARFLNDMKVTDADYNGGGNPVFIEYSPWCGGSPDGKVVIDGEKRLIEIKCPYNSGEHAEHLLMNTQDDLLDYKPEYFYQICANLIFLNLKRGYLISYDPRYVEPPLQIKILPVEITEEVEAIIKERISEAEKQLKVLVAQIRDTVIA